MTARAAADLAAPLGRCLAQSRPRPRVLMVAFHYPPANTPGALRTLKFSKHLGEHGWEASVLSVPVAHASTPDPALLEQIPTTVRVHRARCFDAKALCAIRGKYPAVVEIPDRYVSWLPFALRCGRRLIREDGVDAVYSTSPIPTAHLVAAALKVTTRLPWVADFRDAWSARPGLSEARRAIERRLERAVVQRADRVVTTTPWLAEDLSRLHGDTVRRKARVIFNGYDEDDFLGLASSDAGNTVFRLMHAGQLYPAFRRPAALLQAVRQCLDADTLPPDLELHFLGVDAPATCSSVRQPVSQLRLESNVFVTERIAHRAALAKMCSASVLVVLQAGAASPAHVPSKAFEYLRAGRPVLLLAAADSATNTVLRGFPAVYRADPDDVPAIAAALRDLYAQWLGGLRWIDRRSPALGPYQRRHTAGELARVLDEMVADRRREVAW